MRMVLILLAGLCACAVGMAQDAPSRLWYEAPATGWMQALPVGNGHLGAMVFGRPWKERIQLNEDSMWPGAPDWGDSRGNPADLREIRRLLKAGETKLVDSLIVERFSYKSVLRSHQTLGELYLDFKDSAEVSGYSRVLDLDSALAGVSFSAGGFEYRREILTSYPDDVMAIKLSTNNPRGLNFDIRLHRPDDQGHPTAEIKTLSDSILQMKGMVTQFGGVRHSKSLPITYGVKFDTRLLARAPAGKLKAEKDLLRVSGAPEVVLFIVCKTSFYDEAYSEASEQVLRNLSAESFEGIKDTHIIDYRELYHKAGLSLGGEALDSMDTAKRLARYREGGEDPGLQSLLFQYGRYLLIASSREGSNPANLQGLWNEHLQAPWNADYHLNINLQMNYWLADLTGMGGLNEPYFEFIERALARGKNTAREQYGMSGSVVHHATDLWAPAWMRAERAYWGSWIHGGGWAVQHFWEHFRFSQDTTFLRERAYPAIAEVARFYNDWLVWDESLGRWVSTPETSPENSYFIEPGVPAAVSYGSAMGHQIIAEVFDNYLSAAEILNLSDPLMEEVREKRGKLFPGVVIGSDGRIQEWNEAFAEPEPGHRHISHLYGLYPGISITPADSEAFRAAQRTIDYRLEHGGAGTGWSRALMINMNARLLDSVALGQNVRKFLEISVAPNLFDEHPPFQIDGNFGYTAGVVEALLQSHEGFIRLLPSLPQAWKSGTARGLQARGAVSVELVWEDGILKRAGFRSEFPQKQQIRYNGRGREIELPAGETMWMNSSLETINPK